MNNNVAIGQRLLLKYQQIWAERGIAGTTGKFDSFDKFLNTQESLYQTINKSTMCIVVDVVGNDLLYYFPSLNLTGHFLTEDLREQFIMLPAFKYHQIWSEVNG